MPTATPFNNLITFSRGSNATVTGSNGLIQWAPNNLLTNSESFDAAAWTKNNGTVAANTTAAPDGTLTADKFVENTSNSSHFIIQSATTTATIHTFSVYAKAAGRTFVLVYHDQSNSGAVFNLSNGAITTPSGIPLATASVTDAGNGWYRCAITVTATAASNGFRAQLGDTATNYVYTGDGVSGIFLWGAQLELGSTATTYNPTTVKNLLGFSEAFDNAAWTKSRASIVTGAQANPINGLFNAQKLMENTENNYHYLVRGSLGVTAGTYTLSIYAKAAERSRLLLYFGTTNKGRGFDLATGTTYQQSGVPDPEAYSIVSLGSGWYRCSITANNATPTTAEIYLTSGAAFSYTGDGNSGVYIYGAQLSDSASLDPYVPTPGAAPSSTAFYGPRFDFDPVTRAPRGLLVEEQRTNLILRSEEFNNLSWNKARSSITANATTSPDGTINADKLVENTDVSTSHGMNQVFTGTAASHTFAIYVKAGERSQIRMKLFNGTVFVNETYFDLATGTVGAGTGGTITNVGNGWYRCSITGTLAAASCQAQVFLAVGGSENYTGDGTSGAFIWGAQLEAGAFATSYIPTVASTVTRSADVATISGQNFAQWYRQDEGAIAVDFVSPVAGDRTAVNPSDGTNNNRMTIGFTASSPNNLAVFTGGALQALIGAGTQTPGAVSKMASVYRLNDFASTTNGAVPGTDTSGTVPTVNQLNIGSLAIGGALNGHIRNIRYIPARAADFQLQALTELPLVPTLDLDFLNNLYEA